MGDREDIMTRLVLRVTRGGKLLGSWSLTNEPISMTLVDLQSGEELGVFTASGAKGSVDEVPVTAPERFAGDDLTMPLPERTETAGRLPPTEEVEHPDMDEGRPAPIVPNLASRLAPPLEYVRSDTQELTMPEPESSVTAEIPLTTEELTDGLNDGLTGELRTDTHSFGDQETDTGIRDLTLGPEITSGLTPSREPVGPAEVWVRRRDEWRAAGHLEPGRRAVAKGGWVRLGDDGRLEVSPGPELSGSGTLLDGSTVDIRAGLLPTRLPPGASVLLRSGDYGLYVRSDLNAMR